MKDKLEIYQNAGIPEYWVVDPEHEFAIMYWLNDEGKYIGSIPFTNVDNLQSQVLEGFQLDMSKVF